MADPILALSIPPPPTIHPTAISLPRSISPVPRPPSRSETLLRHTLHKDLEKRPSSPTSAVDDYWRLRRGNSNGSAVVVPVSGGLSATRPTATRIQSSPVPLAHSPPRHYHLHQQHHPNSVHHSRSNSISPSSIPLPLPQQQQQLATTPPPFSPLSHEPSSAAKRRLERTLTRNDSRVVQVEVSRRSSQHRFSGASLSSSPTPRLLTLGTLPMEFPSQQTSASGPSPTTATTTEHTLLSNSPQSRTNSLESSLSSELPETPPPSPPFNAVDAARVCASIEGVVHFEDIEGLGAPVDLEEGREEGKMSRNARGLGINSWWNWWREKVR